jgi:hypothetical protein
MMRLFASTMRLGSFNGEPKRVIGEAFCSDVEAQSCSREVRKVNDEAHQLHCSGKKVQP